MRRAYLGLACLCLSLHADAQTTRPASRPKRPPQQITKKRSSPIGRRTPPSFAGDAAKIAAELKLSADQRIAFDALMEKMRNEVAEKQRARATGRQVWAESMAAARREIQDARRADDAKRVAEWGAKIDALRAERRMSNPYDELFARIGSILTEEQKTQLPALQKKYPEKAKPKQATLPNRQRVLAMARSLKLTDDQKESITAVDKAFSMRMSTAPIFDPDEYREFKLDFVNALAALLNEDQRKRFQSLVGSDSPNSVPAGRVKRIAARTGFMLGVVKKMDLSDAQKARLAQVEKDFAERIRNRKPHDFDENRKLRRDLKVALGRLLTAEQLVRFEEAIEKERNKGTATKRRAAAAATSRPSGDKAPKPKPPATDKP